MGEVVALRGVGKTYAGGTTAIEDLSLSVAAGQV